MSESVQSIPTFAAGDGKDDAAQIRLATTGPSMREWIRHGMLFALTAITATWAGITILFPGTDFAPPFQPAPTTFVDYLLFVPRYFVDHYSMIGSYAVAHPALIGDGITFALALLAILLAHESGHYVACRLYPVDATLPFFIPLPPPFMAGTLGAFIKIKSPIPSRRALFDIGVAGPLAGFIALIPIAVAGLLLATPQTIPADPTGAVRFNDPLLIHLLAGIFGVDLTTIAVNPYYFAAWIGLFVTSLNLLPVGQLDGGHAVYAIFRARTHSVIGRVAFLIMVALVPLGWYFHGAPTGLLYAVLLFVLLRLRHPQPENDNDAPGPGRVIVALLTFIVFLLSFLPFPITIL
jgi:membrane-associated protease RseP (regulator of RpoE activity)